MAEVVLVSGSDLFEEVLSLLNPQKMTDLYNIQNITSEL
jgi:hypothetical protein